MFDIDDINNNKKIKYTNNWFHEIKNFYYSWWIAIEYKKIKNSDYEKCYFNL